MKEGVPSPSGLKLYYCDIITDRGTYGIARVSIAVHACETTRTNVGISNGAQ